MKLRYLEVRNYRSIRNAKKLELFDSTTIVGSNNEGKSNLVRALECAISTLQIANRLMMTRSRVIKSGAFWQTPGFKDVLGRQIYVRGVYAVSYTHL